MGLDLFAHGVDPKKFEHIPPLLCGSMFTDGKSSIRGKAYASLIDEICDVNLYQDKLKPNELQRIITRLQVYLMDINNNQSKKTDYDGFSYDEIAALLMWFTIVKENNGTVIGWW
jgi:hypothetical protein